MLVYAHTHDYRTLLRIQLLAILLSPTLSALVFADVRSGIRWYVAFVSVFQFAGFAGIALQIPSPLPEWLSSLALALNVTVGGTIAVKGRATWRPGSSSGDEAVRPNLGPGTRRAASGGDRGPSAVRRRLARPRT
jgi:hypothetical protein